MLDTIKYYKVGIVSVDEMCETDNDSNLDVTYVAVISDSSDNDVIAHNIEGYTDTVDDYISVEEITKEEYDALPHAL